MGLSVQTLLPYSEYACTCFTHTYNIQLELGELLLILISGAGTGFSKEQSESGADLEGRD